MARPQSADYDDRRRAILDAAADLFAERGFHGCSISDLANACGMSKSLLYHYFTAKEGILFEVMQSHMVDLEAVLAQSEGIEDPKARFHAMLMGFMQLYHAAASRHKVLVNDLDKLPAEHRAEIVVTQRRLISIMGGTIGQMAPNLAQDKAKLGAATMLFFGMINWTHTWFKPGDGLDTDQLAGLVEQVFTGGIEAG